MIIGNAEKNPFPFGIPNNPEICCLKNIYILEDNLVCLFDGRHGYLVLGGARCQRRCRLATASDNPAHLDALAH